MNNLDNLSSVQYRLWEGDVVVLDGGHGSELEARGIRSVEGPWSAHALRHETGQQVVKDIYRDYIDHSADIITTATFRTPALEDFAETATRIAVDLALNAREEADRPEVL